MLVQCALMVLWTHDFKGDFLILSLIGALDDSFSDTRRSWSLSLNKVWTVSESGSAGKNRMMDFAGVEDIRGPGGSKSAVGVELVTVGVTKGKFFGLILTACFCYLGRLVIELIMSRCVYRSNITHKVTQTSWSSVFSHQWPLVQAQTPPDAAIE